MSDLEAEFALHELFFSKTNKKGTIEAGNNVFIRVSEFSREELLNKPHNIIRHTDMPRSVFKLFWSYLEAGKPIAAYVKNRSKHGRYYWVFAMAFPLEDGYLSIRLKPSSKYFPIIKKLYMKMVYDESKEMSLEEGVEFINQNVRDLGFSDYTDFMTRALVEELTYRDQLLLEKSSSGGLMYTPVEFLQNFLMNSSQNTLAARQTFFKTHRLFEKSSVLLQQCQELLDVCHRVKYVTVNLMLASSRLQEAGKPLGAVAMNLQELTTQILQSSVQFEEVFKSYEKSVFEMFVSVAVSRFQIEMMSQLAQETVVACAEESDFSGAVELEFHNNCNTLKTLIEENFKVVGQTSRNLDQSTKSMLESIQTLNKVTSGMGVLHVVGKIEMVRVGAGEGLGSRLSEMEALNALFKSTLGNLERECKLNVGICEELCAHEEEIKLRLMTS